MDVEMNRTSESRNLDLLRSLAVLFVVVYHLLLYFQLTRPRGINLEFGHWGVLLFFVHTCLVLMFSLERQNKQPGNNSLFGPFYVRRFFRIFPLSLLVVLTVYALRLPVAHLRDGIFRSVGFNWHELLPNLLLVQNLTHTDSIIAPLWSLPYELQMYLVLPVLFLIARATRGVYAIGLIWIFSVLLAVRALHVHRFEVPDMLYYVPCFVAGVVAYKLTKSRSWDFPFFGWPLALAIITVIYLYWPSRQGGWICCLLVAVLLPQFREMRAGPLFSACHHVARYSYGIYLTHFALIWFSFVSLHALPLVLRWLVFLSLLVALPILLYHTVEAPMIAFGHQLLSPSSRLRPSHPPSEVRLT
jgi:peptidoglycan/LPS O-acetylase OafA/YrhL